MKCFRRHLRTSLASKRSGATQQLQWRSRPGVVSPLSALRASKSSAPLSLNDIIAFESQLPSLVVQEVAAPEERVEQLISRASRVLEEVNSVLLAEDPTSGANTTITRSNNGSSGRTASPQQGQGQQGSGEAAAGVVLGEAGLSDLSRAVFGGSSQVSEREGSRMRQALQKTLQQGAAAAPATAPATAANSSTRSAATAPPDRTPPSSSPSSSSSSTASLSAAQAPAAAADPELPSWAQALFSNPSPGPPAGPSTEAGRGSGGGGGGGSAASGPGTSSGDGSRSAGAPAATAVKGAAGAGAVAGSLAGPPSSPSSAPPGPAPLPLQPQAAPRRTLAEWAPLAFAEADLSLPTELLLKSEESIFSQAARSAVLPPLQSVVDLTAAVRPPTRGLDLGSAVAAAAASPELQSAVSDGVSVSEEAVVQGAALGRRLADGAGRLADGTRFEKLSGTDTGPDGYVKKWEVLRGVTGDGRVQWEECWWQASNRFGLRELGAFKKGTAESGASWVEEWKEVLHTHPTNLRLVIERTAHKWARDENADEWEEKWGESFEEAGRVHKWADKWAKAGSNVWHERWGEDYDGRGACQKWTDKWAERLLPDGGQEQWGDKWTETFGAGKGTKHGEVWSSSSGGSRYNRWWNEEHFGDGRVRKWGNSTSGEYWDTVEHMDTYYNPVPHFGFKHAVGHSPQLWSVPLPAPDEGGDSDDGLGEGLGRL